MRSRITFALLLGLPSAAEGQPPVRLLPIASREIERAEAIAISASGELVAVATRGGLMFLDASKLEVLRTLEATAEPAALAIDDTGKRIFIADRRGHVRAIDVATGLQLAHTRLDETPGSIDVSPDGRFVAVGRRDGQIAILTDELRLVRLLRAPDFHDREVIFVAWGQGGDQLFGATSDGAVAWWNGGSTAPMRSSSPNRTGIVSAARDFTGDMLAVGVKSLKLIRERGQMSTEASYAVEVIDWRRGQQVAAIDLDARQLRAVAVAPLRSAVATIDMDGELIVWDVGRGERLTTVQGPEGATAMIIGADGRRLVTLAADRVELWEAGGLSAPDAGMAIDFGREFDRRRFEITTDSIPLIVRTEPGRVAILGLAPLGADSITARSADNLLATRIASSSIVTLVERDALDRVLREVRFQNSGITSPDEAARIGAMLNAGRVIVGSVSRLGSVVVISARVISVENSAVLGAREVRCNQCRPEDLPDAIHVLARTLIAF